MSPLPISKLPMVCAVGVASAKQKPGVVTQADGSTAIEARWYLPMLFVGDHRTMSFVDGAPFAMRLEDIFNDPGQMKDWI